MVVLVAAETGVEEMGVEVKEAAGRVEVEKEEEVPAVEAMVEAVTVVGGMVGGGWAGAGLEVVDWVVVEMELETMAAAAAAGARAKVTGVWARAAGAKAKAAGARAARREAVPAGRRLGEATRPRRSAAPQAWSRPRW